MSKRFLAFDLGAESGRAELVTLSDDRVEMREFHRFPNRPVRLGDTLYWDFPFLFAQILTALRICAEQDISLDGIGLDTWGVDFGLLGRDRQLISNPVHYRDSRTDGIHEYSDPIMPREEVFRKTCCEPWAISSLFQLLAMKKDGSPVLEAAGTFLNMPDLFNFYLTGEMVSERSIASTSNLMGPDGRWNSEIIERFNLPAIFVELKEPGQILGPLPPSIQDQTGLGPVPVILTLGHDTSAAVAAVPARGKNWAFLSCGTWSIIGRLCPEPVLTAACLEAGFSNEYTLGTWFLCRNISGLWLVQELCRQWDRPSDPWDYGRLTGEASSADSTSLFDVSDESLLAPADMEQALLKLMDRLGQPRPATKGELVRSVLESLACEYAVRLEIMDRIISRPSESLYLVGGGVANRLLCQWTADAIGLEVEAGAAQCTAYGNALTQAMALEAVESQDEIRRIMRNSHDLITYHPGQTDEWKEKVSKYKEMLEKNYST
ncbi:MAG: rhamnulokinase family protein [Candidatus Adiutricales bacterium]